LFGSFVLVAVFASDFRETTVSDFEGDGTLLTCAGKDEDNMRVED
jgi:hypothetical protein